VVSTVLYPVQWLMVQPLEFFSRGADYFHALQTAQDQADTARKEVLQLSLRANQAQELLQENERLRKQNVRLEQRLKQAETIIEIQKKVSEILGIPLAGIDESEGDV